MDVKKNVALVTGSTRGIGLAIGKALLEKGAIVYFNSRHLRDWKALGLESENAHYLKGDTSDESEMQKVFSTIKKNIGSSISSLTMLLPINQIVKNMETTKNFTRSTDTDTISVQC